MNRSSLFRCLSGTILLLVASRASAEPALSTFSHLRAVDPIVASIIARGADSPTFSALRDRIDHSDVIVVIERTPCTGRGRAGTQLVTDAGGFRYVRVTLQIARGGDPEVALLGHELRHVVELVEASEVRSELEYRGLYERIGRRSSCAAPAGCFETGTAQAAGATVLRELQRTE